MIRFVLFLIITRVGTLSADLSVWSTLDQAEVKRKMDPLTGLDSEYLVFTEEILKLEGERVRLEGYVIPLEPTTKQSYFVLSRFPYQSCFFCGAAGPDTVVEVYAPIKNPSTDEKVTVEGILELNENDPLHLFYILRDADVVDR